MDERGKITKNHDVFAEGSLDLGFLPLFLCIFFFFDVFESFFYLGLGTNCPFWFLFLLTAKLCLD
jgi:hypothetical protein